MKMNYLHRAGALILALVLTLSLCTFSVGAESGRSVVAIDQKNLTIAVQERTQLTAVVTRDGTAVERPSLKWTMEANDVVTLTESTGYIRGQKPGRVTITATYADGSTDTCTVTVVEPVVTLDKTALTLSEGETAVLTATAARGANGAATVGTGFKWTSSDAGVATVDQNGVVTAVSGGVVTITAAYTNNKGVVTEYAADCTVAVLVDVAEVTLGIKEGQEVCDPGDKVTLEATVLPDNATDKSVRWSSSNTAVATVDSNGVMTAKAPGKATITVTTTDGGFTAAREITVSGLVIAARKDILVGHQATLTVERFGNAVGESLIEWSSSNISVAEVEAGKVTTYNLGNTTITAKIGKYKATCVVTVEEDMADAVITSMDAAEVYSFSGLLSQINSKIYAKTGENLNYVSSLTVPTSQGVLYYGYVSPNVTGQGVGNENYYYTRSGSRKALADVTFVPKSGFSGTAIITYSARDAGGGVVNGSIRISVSSVSDVAYSTASGAPVTFATEDFTQVCRAKTGREISYITFTPPPFSQGALYYNYNTSGQYCPEVTGDIKYYRTNNPYLDQITFVPAEDFTGTVTIPYSCTTAGGTHPGAVTITVYAAPGSEDGKVIYSVVSGDRVELNASDFNNLCWDMNGTSLNYVYFTQPDADEGALYYDYKAINSYGAVVSETTRYFRSSSPRISLISFVPAPGFNGTVRLPITGYDSLGEVFSAELVFKVSGTTGSVHYSTAYCQPLEFDGLDFNESCVNATGAGLNWISFELPDSDEGVLYRYYNSSYSSKLSATTKISRSQLSDIVFVPDPDFFGTVVIPFSGYDTNGGRFSGEVTILVKAATGKEIVTYSTISGGAVELSASDFNDACRAITGENLSYVQFSSQPAAKHGKLYYQYNENKGTGTTVYSGTRYYRNQSRLLGSVSFVAANGYNGSFTMTYTGYSTGNKKFVGKVEFLVSKPIAAPIRYAGSSLPITLKTEDFSAACAATLGRDLEFIRFTGLPAGAQGRLYCNYRSVTEPGTIVNTDTSYYVRQSPAVGKLTFLAQAEYQGEVTLAYTGYDVLGKSFSGTVVIRLSYDNCTTQFRDLNGYEWAAPSIEFLRNAGVVEGYGNDLYGPQDRISRGQWVLMLYRAMQFKGDGSPVSYDDVSPASYYGEAIAAATQLGIAEGSNGKFYPDMPISRQSAVNMLYRAMEATGQEVPLVSTSILYQRFNDSDEIADYAKQAMAVMVAKGILVGDSGYLNPTDNISRAEMAMVLHRVLTM